MKKPYRVVKLDLDEKKAFVEPVSGQVNIYTRPLYTVDIVNYEILDERSSELDVKLVYARVLLE